MQDHDTKSAQPIVDRIDPARAAALHQALDLDGPPPGEGTALPPFFHQIYFWDIARPGEMGSDGHPKTGNLIPDLGLPRRMWAGGRLTFHAPFRAGVRAEKTSNLVNYARKTGRSGQLGLVTLRHIIRQKGQPVITEEQDLIYRPAPLPNDTAPEPPQAPEGGTIVGSMSFNSTLLFRYSALTMNSHRIHYDQRYAISTENYDGLVVHGPLLAQILMLISDTGPNPLKSFTFRATAPLFQSEDATFVTNDKRIWIRGPKGRMIMDAEVG